MAWQRLSDVVAEERMLLAIARFFGWDLNPTPNEEFWDGILRVDKPVECKADWAASESPNVFFEIRNTRDNKPSGMAATKAQVWVHYAEGWHLLFVFNPKKMLRHIAEVRKRNPEKFPLTPPGMGDGNSQGYLAKIEDLQRLPFVWTFDWNCEGTELPRRRKGHAG